MEPDMSEHMKKDIETIADIFLSYGTGGWKASWEELAERILVAVNKQDDPERIRFVRQGSESPVNYEWLEKRLDEEKARGDRLQWRCDGLVSENTRLEMANQEQGTRIRALEAKLELDKPEAYRS